jgi:hypothetical protein
MKNIFVLSILTMLIAGCFAKGKVTSTAEDSSANQPNIPNEPSPQTATSEFIAGEVVTTPSGFVIKGTFGEISEKKTLANGYQIEGAFYE